MGLQRVGHDWATELNWTELNWRREWLPTSGMPGEFHGQRRLVGYSPLGCKEFTVTEQLALSLFPCSGHCKSFLGSNVSLCLKLYPFIFSIIIFSIHRKFLPPDGIRFHRLMVQSIRHPHPPNLPSEVSWKPRLLPVFLTDWLHTGGSPCPSLDLHLINFLEEVTELKETLYLLD